MLLSSRAVCHYKSGNSRAAFDDCNASLQLRPADIKTLLRRALALESLERYQLALNDYRVVLRLAPQTPPASEGAARCGTALQGQAAQGYDYWKNKGNDAVKSSRFDSAADHYSRCIAIDAANPVAYGNRALCWLKLQLYRDAISDCDAALARQPGNVKALYRKAQALAHMQQPASAAECLVAVLKYDPKNTVAESELQELRAQHGASLGVVESKADGEPF